MNPTENKKPKVVIVGAGFGGLWAARTLAHQPVDVVVIDRNNYHTFLAAASCIFIRFLCV